MKRLWCVLGLAPVFGWLSPLGFCNGTPDVNVNSRYTIESVEVKPVARKRLSSSLQEDLDRFIGSKVDQERIEDVSRRLKTELRATAVRHRLEKGNQPEHVKLMFETDRRRLEEEPRVTKLAYHSRQGWTGGVTAGGTVKGVQMQFGVQSDGDELMERYAGFNTGASKTFADRVRVGFDFSSFHQQWNGNTVLAASSSTAEPGIYRERMSYRPSVTVSVARPVTFTAGVDLQQVQMQYPAVRWEAANAAFGTLRYHQHWKELSDLEQDVEASYSIRSGTRALGTDFGYTRHLAKAQYVLSRNDQEFILAVLGGTISGQAPLFDRFLLGNTSTLRGWSKYDLAPLGGSRVWHTSAEYRVHSIQLFYDTGAVWDAEEEVSAKHAAGFGYAEGNFAVSVGFPLRNGKVTPVFLLALRF